MAKSQDLQSRDLPMELFIFILFEPIKLKSSRLFSDLLPNKQCCLIASLQEKNSLQIITFLASGGRIEKNFEALLMKVIESLGGGTRRKILSSINESLGGSHRSSKRDGRLDPARPDS